MYLRLISSRIKSRSESVIRIGRLCRAFCAWFLLHTLLGIFSQLLTLHIDMDVKLCVSEQWYYFVALFVPSNNLCNLAYSSCTVIWQKIHQMYWFFHWKSILLDCVGFWLEFNHIGAHFVLICFINGVVFICLNQCRYVVTDTIKYNLIFFQYVQ